MDKKITIKNYFLRIKWVIENRLIPFVTKIAPKIRHAIPINETFVTSKPDSEKSCSAQNTKDNPIPKNINPGITKNCRGCSMEINFRVDTKTQKVVHKSNSLYSSPYNKGLPKGPGAFFDS